MSEKADNRQRDAERNYRDADARLTAASSGTPEFQRAVDELRDSRDALDDAQQVRRRERGPDSE